MRTCNLIKFFSLFIDYLLGVAFRSNNGHKSFIIDFRQPLYRQSIQTTFYINPLCFNFFNSFLPFWFIIFHYHLTLFFVKLRNCVQWEGPDAYTKHLVEA